MKKTAIKWQVPPLSQLAYYIGSIAAIVLLALGLYEAVMTKGVKAHVVFSAFLTRYAVWALLCFVIGFILRYVLKRAHK